MTSNGLTPVERVVGALDEGAVPGQLHGAVALSLLCVDCVGRENDGG